MGGRPQSRWGPIWRTAGVMLVIGLAGCTGRQSALDPAGRAAEELRDLFWWMTLGAGIVWTIVVGAAIHAIRVPPGPESRDYARMIIGGGVIFPTVVLAGLLAYGLSLMPRLLSPAPEGSLRIEVIGEQWWWRVRYPGREGPIELANEIRLPVNEPVEFHLEAGDVIHSFWIPALGGKVDNIPGRRTRLLLEPTRTGRFRGICAEYCGGSHALMAFDVIVSDRAEFDAWLVAQAREAAAPATPEAERGLRSFLSHGCGACHRIRGTPADGLIAPDLTHIGSRLSIGAALVENSPAQMARWISGADRMKPAVHMPSFDMLEPGELQDLASYLEGLE